MKDLLSNIRMDLPRAFFSYAFFLSVFGVCMALFFSIVPQLRASANGSMQLDVLNLYNLAHFQGFSILSAIFATVPYSLSFCMDWNNQFIRSVIIRTDVRSYSISKVLTSALAGGSAVALGEALFIIFLYLNFSLVGANDLNSLEYGNLISEGHFIIFFVLQTLIKFFAAAFFATLALWISTYFNNVFVTLAVPVLSFYFLITIPLMIGISMRWFYNALMGGAYANNLYASALYSFLICCLLIILMGILATEQIRRRLEHG